MTKKAAIYIPHYFSPHLEVDLELMHKHLAAGDDVVVYVCGGELSTCYGNPSRDQSVCDRCVVRRRNALNLVGIAEQVEVRSFVNLKPADLEVLKQYQGVQVESAEDLVKIKLGSCLLGKLVLNELICHTSEPKPDLSQHRDFVTRAIESAALVYLSFRNHFSEERPDIFYTFNGRFVVAQPSIAAAIESGTAYAVHDRAHGAMNRYCLVKNNALHSLSYWKSRIDSIWDESAQTGEQKEAAAAAWFDARRQKQKQGWFSYITDQTEDMPPGFDPNKTNIVIFNSSEFEVAAMDDYRSPFYADQNDGVLHLARDLQHASDLSIYLRIHPHLKNKDGNSQTAFIEKNLTNKFPNFHVIPAESPISTYQLMTHADLVVTFGSTTGMEAAYNLVPCLLLGRAWYEDVGACTTVQSHAEAVKYILDKGYKLTDEELQHRRKLALKYGYFFLSEGEPLELFEQTDIFEMVYKGGNPRCSTITNEPPTFEEGLKKELSRRKELRSVDNPLRSVVKELETVADCLSAENAELKAELQSVKRTLAEMQSLLGTRPHQYIRRVAHLKHSIARRLGSFLS